MDAILNIPVRNDILLSLNSNKSEFGSELKTWAAISMYYFGKISLPSAARLADMHRYDFEQLLAKYKLPINLLDENDAEDEIQTINKL